MAAASRRPASAGRPLRAWHLRMNRQFLLAASQHTLPPNPSALLEPPGQELRFIRRAQLRPDGGFIPPARLCSRRLMTGLQEAEAPKPFSFRLSTAPTLQQKTSKASVRAIQGPPCSNQAACVGWRRQNIYADESLLPTQDVRPSARSGRPSRPRRASSGSVPNHLHISRCLRDSANRLTWQPPSATSRRSQQRHQLANLRGVR